jgi:DNA-binding SARP family transcriptional activator
MPDQDASSATLSIALTRGFELRNDGLPVDLPHSAQRLVALVALLGRPVARAYAAGTLWLDMAEERAQANLRSALWRLRRPGFDVIRSTGDRLMLDTQIRVDVHEMSAWAHHLDRDGADLDDSRIDELIHADELLPDWYDDWLILERERFQQLRLHALETCCLKLAACGRHGRAIEVGLAAVATESLRESAHRALIGVYLAEGNLGAAVRQYDRYRTLLADELGLQPSPLMRDLVKRLPQTTVGWT